MNAALGTAGITLGLAGSLVGAVTLAYGLVRHRPRLVGMAGVYALLIGLGALLAVFAMERALLTDDFSLTYVAEHSSTRTPLLFKVATLWAALEGSIILWAVVLAGYLGLVVRRFRTRLTDPMVGWALLTLFVIAAFFFWLMSGPANPFTEVAGAVPADGPGPNPLLQNHVLMAFHPPMLYLGYVGFSVPFAFAIAALVTGRLGEGWLLETRRWTLVAWGFLTVGIVLGAWWSYEVLGWGGYWGWDPVENASFLPWLTGTAYLHSVLVQERRGMLRVWNLSLLCATFALTILGTFLTRSGVIDSVHAFSESDIGPSLLAFFTLIVVVSVGLIGWRGDRLRSPGTIDSPLSREGAFLANNILFAAFAFVILLGTVFPLLIEAFNGDRISVGRPYFDRMTMPLGLAILTLMAVAPVLPWRKASGELLRHRLIWPAWSGAGVLVLAVVLGARGLAPLLAFFLAGVAGGAAVRQLVLATRRQGLQGFLGRANGGMVVHLGVVVIAVAFAASSSFAHEAEFRLSPGESAELAGHRVTYLGVETIEYPEKTALKARVQLDDGRIFAPALQQFPFATQSIGVPSVRTGLTEDIYLTLVAAPDDPAGEAVIGVLVMPLTVWLWVGGGLMALGTLLAAWPGRRRRPTDPVSAPVPEHRPAGRVPADEPSPEPVHALRGTAP
ncbi:MAG: heme lyase CcmF/NrfE family subunit [Acidimicrobiales bacterium]|nr:heme lyase CcmF/NrfE family subunit [Acidimicrobiales bacterium]